MGLNGVSWMERDGYTYTIPYIIKFFFQAWGIHLVFANMVY